MSTITIPAGPPTKTAIITGVTSQDGTYLAEHLISIGYLVHGIKRRGTRFATDRLDRFYRGPESDRRLLIHAGDLTDSLNITRLLKEIQPDEIYNLAACFHSKLTIESPEYTANSDGLGTLRLVEAIHLLGLSKKTRLCQALTSDLAELVLTELQGEETPAYARSQGGIAQLYAYWITINYREAYGIHATNAIVFTHESPQPGEIFMSRGLSRHVARIALGLESTVVLGNLSASRNWGHPRDYAVALHELIQKEKPGDHLIATGIKTTLRDFVKLSFGILGISLEFEGKDANEVGKIASVDSAKFIAAVGPEYLEAVQGRVGQIVVQVNEKEFTPLAPPKSKGQSTFDWTPKYDLEELTEDLVRADLKVNKNPRFYE
jgi:GDPmannose 4,6-dehydratase